MALYGWTGTTFSDHSLLYYWHFIHVFLVIKDWGRNFTCTFLWMALWSRAKFQEVIV